MRHHHQLPFGAELVDGGVRFRLWAPRARSVSLLLDRADERASGSLPMTSEPGGWFSLVTNQATVGSRYKYLVDGEGYPDPASRFQPGGVHEASEIIDPGAYQWRDDAWRGRAWEEFVIYELHI